MQLTTMVKLVPTPQQRDLLLATLQVCNAACNRISELAFQTRVFRQFDLHKVVYYDIRKSFTIPASHVVRAIAKVAHAYKLDTLTQRSFDPLGAIELDARLLAWEVDHQIARITTSQGKIVVPFLCSAAHKHKLQGKLGQADLLLQDGEFYLSVAVTVEEAPPFDPSGMIGVDLGIVNVATDSEGNQYTGERIQKVRWKYRKLRQQLQAKKTRSARKWLAKIRRKESRFIRDTNHCVSKSLVELALSRQKALVIEVLVRRSGSATRPPEPAASWSTLINTYWRRIPRPKA